MAVGKSHALRCEPIEIGSLDATAKTFHIRPAGIVEQYQQEVRLVRCRNCERECCPDQARQYAGHSRAKH